MLRSCVFLQLEKYHEQAQLLDPHVGPIVDALTQVIRREALSSSGADWDALREASTFLWALITVRCPAQPLLPPLTVHLTDMRTAGRPSPLSRT